MVSALFAGLLAASSLSTAYVDPDGAFAMELPSGWTATRSDLGNGTHYIATHARGNEEGPHVDVVTQKLPSEVDPDSHDLVNKTLADTFLEGFGQEVTITKSTRTNVTFDKRKALRIDLEFKSDGVPIKGFLVAVTGKRSALLVMPYAPAKDEAGFKLASDHAFTVAVESRTPNSLAPASAGPLSQAALGAIAGRIKQNMKREAADKVVSPGNPPLTYGSISNFITVIELLFDVQLTEAEFDATRARFVEYYAKADAEGKRILAEQGASLLSTLTTGTPEEREQSRREGREVFEQAFSRGAEMGIGYAQVMWDAITRRQARLATAKTAPAKQEWDQEITEGDIDATLEMLYFMWVAAGRDASDVTMDDVARIRQQIVTELPNLDPQLQLLIANAPKVYAGIRQQWQAAQPLERVAMAQRFGAALDEWGIGAQSSFQQSSGGGSGEYSMNAQIAQNTAWNAAKTWSSGS